MENKTFDEVVKILKSQEAKGLKKYGFNIDGNTAENPEYWLTHIQEELADALFYITKLKQILNKK